MHPVRPDTRTLATCVLPSSLIYWPGRLEDSSLVVTRDIPQSDFTHDGLYTAFTRVAEKLSLKVGQVLWPVRIALTGKTKGPDILAAILLLGRDETIRRLELAKSKLD